MSAPPTGAGSKVGRKPARNPTCTASIVEGGQDPARVVPLAGSEAIQRRCDEATGEARRLGIFGVPTFVVGREFFRGDDRLEDAVEWLRSGPPR